MTPSLPMAPRRAAGLWMALAAVVMPMPAAHAEANPYYGGVSVGVGHLSNITLARDGATHFPDIYTSYGLVGGFDQPIGRQRLYASGSVTANKFQDYTQYDNTSYNLNAGLDWSTVERLSGSVNLGLQQRLDYGSVQSLSTNDKNTARAGQASARVQYGLVELLSLEGVVSHRDVRYSAPAYVNSRLRQDAASVGIRYRLGGQLDLGAAVRITRGRYPIYTFDRRDLDLTANWAATGASTLNARLSLGRQDNSAIVNDFSGATGQLQWTYAPTGKLRFVTTLRRDTGADSGIETVRDIADPTRQFSEAAEFARLTTTVALAASYEASAKIRFNASMSQARRSLQNTSLVFGNTSGRDTTTTTSLGASYAPTRNWLLACDLGRQSRSADAAVSYPYGNTSGSCSAQYVVK